MRIGMGSLNKTKLEALESVLADYLLFRKAEVVGVDAVTDVNGHPKSLEETISGAIARAKKAQEGNVYGFGIEGGLMAVPYTKSGYMEVAACAIYDGAQIHLGLSPALEWPGKVTDCIVNQGLDGSAAMKACGLDSGEGKLGEREGFIGIVTKGRITRTDYNRMAVMMALTHLEFPEHY